MKRIWGVLALAGVMLATGCGLDPAGRAGLARGGKLAARGSVNGQGGAPWTVFIYMAADNNLSDAAGYDLQELEDGLGDTDVRFVVLVDQAQQGDSRLLEMAPDPKRDWDHLTSKPIDDRGAIIPASRELDSGSPATLEKFIRWGANRYPSERSMLVLWNHGGGAFANPGDGIKSFCSDDQARSTLTLTSLAQVAERVADQQRFDVIGLDMCLLGHVEVAHQLAPLADYMVASEKLEPGMGWDYQALAWRLTNDPTLAPAALARSIAVDYQSYYADMTLDETTQSAIDLRGFDKALLPALNRLADHLREGLADRTIYGGVKAALGEAYRLSAPVRQETSAVDLGLALLALSREYDLPKPLREEAAAVLKTYRAIVLENRTTIASNVAYTGLKIYFNPDGYKPIYADGSRQSFGTQAWNQFLLAYHSK